MYRSIFYSRLFPIVDNVSVGVNKWAEQTKVNLKANETVFEISEFVAMRKLWQLMRHVPSIFMSEFVVLIQYAEGSNGKKSVRWVSS
jgi:hypothetical protein